MNSRRVGFWQRTVDSRNYAGELAARKQAATAIADKIRDSGYDKRALEFPPPSTPISKDELAYRNVFSVMLSNAQEQSRAEVTMQMIERWFRELPAPPRIFRRAEQR